MPAFAPPVRRIARPAARRLVHVPVEALGEDEAPCDLEPEPMDDADSRHQSRELLAAAGDAELRCLLYGVMCRPRHWRARSLAPWKSAPATELANRGWRAGVAPRQPPGRRPRR